MRAEDVRVKKRITCGISWHLGIYELNFAYVFKGDGSILELANPAEVSFSEKIDQNFTYRVILTGFSSKKEAKKAWKRFREEFKGWKNKYRGKEILSPQEFPTFVEN